jgi:signal transduction histidine kinase
VEAAKTTALRQLVAGLAHELNNPVSAIAGNIEPLREHLATVRRLAATAEIPEIAAVADRIARGLELIARGSERAVQVVADLRSYAGVGECHPWPFDVEESIERVLRLLQSRWAGRIVIHRSYAAVPLLRFAGTDLNQVFMNVIANACDAIPSRGNVWIATTADAETIAVEVRDDGIGIATAHLPHVFDPFFTTKAEGKGRGLGLAISQGIVTSHGGTMRVTSVEGSGTECAIVLPRCGVARAPRRT